MGLIHHQTFGVDHVDRNSADRKLTVKGFLGVGIDENEGHQRLTRTDHFLLVGGSQETHERMQDTAIYFNEELKNRGKTLQETSLKEALDMLHKASDR